MPAWLMVILPYWLDPAMRGSLPALLLLSVQVLDLGFMLADFAMFGVE